MNSDNNTQQKKQQFPSLRQTLIIALVVLAIGSYLFPLYANQPTVQDASLAEVVSAIETDAVEKITVRGDYLVATLKDGTKLGTRKESNISTVEALQILGAPSESLKTLPIVIENPDTGLSTLFSILLTFGPLLLIGYIFFRVFRQAQGGGGMFGMPGRVGRSNPRVVSGAAEKDKAIERPIVTFDDVAGAEQAKMELQEQYLRQLGSIDTADLSDIGEDTVNKNRLWHLRKQF